MIGIVSYGGYLPLQRINRDTVSKAMGWLHQAAYMKGEKCVANYDEDSVTMAVAAAMHCVRGHDREQVDGLYFATTTAPFRERRGADIMVPMAIPSFGGMVINVMTILVVPVLYCAVKEFSLKSNNP